MSDIIKNSTSYRKRAQQDSILPSPGNKTLVFQHQASGGESTIDLSALVVPTILSGYANPSFSDLLGSRLSLYPGSMTLMSSLNGVLQPDVTWKVNIPGQIAFQNGYTLTNGEIVTGVIRPVNTDGVLVTDARALTKTGTLTAGNDTIVTDPFTVNKYSTYQVGDVLVYLNGQIQFRNVGNATAAPSADGNYQEVPVAGGLTNQIKLNSPVGVDTPYMVISNGLVAERPTNSLMAAIEAVQGKVDAMIPDLAALAGVPTTNYSSQTPTNVDLAALGTTVLTLQNLLAGVTTLLKNNIGTQYDLTVTGTNWTTSRAKGVPYQTIDGTWRMKFNIVGTYAGAGNSNQNNPLTISGVSFPAVNQAISALWNNIQGSGIGGLTANVYTSGDLYAFWVNSVNYNSVWAWSGDVELTAKPSFVT